MARPSLSQSAVFIFRGYFRGYKIPDTMFSFDGQYESRRAVSLGGASKKVTSHC